MQTELDSDNNQSKQLEILERSLMCPYPNCHKLFKSDRGISIHMNVHKSYKLKYKYSFSASIK